LAKQANMSKNLPKSPLAPATFPVLAPVVGVVFHTAYAGVRYKPGRDDLLLARFTAGTSMAGVYTTSTTASAAVRWCQQAGQGGTVRALLVVAGNSLAGTGAHGVMSCAALAEAVSSHIGCQPSEVQFSATGVIGEPMPVERVVAGFGSLCEVDFATAARAILTTDTFAKGASRCAQIDNVAVTLSGFAKGSGMIMPNMATMLGYIFTDAALPADVLQHCLSDACARSFNCITVDGDTSTSDTVQLFATNMAAHAMIVSADDPRLTDFRAALQSLCLDLATQVVKDGEGAQKFITINVSGAKDFHSARALGLVIGNSPLVKTAIAGADANWGRIVMAVGKSGEPINAEALSVSFGGITICRNGMRVDGYDEAPVAAHLKGSEVVVDVDVGVGDGAATVYTCDLTHGYISINGDYRS
jgi:glutamate N-acetyltransferase / amino-acid N-acetyltransferase